MASEPKPKPDAQKKCPVCGTPIPRWASACSMRCMTVVECLRVKSGSYGALLALYTGKGPRDA